MVTGALMPLIHCDNLPPLDIKHLNGDISFYRESKAYARGTFHWIRLYQNRKFLRQRRCRRTQIIR